MRERGIKLHPLVLIMFAAVTVRPVIISLMLENIDGMKTAN